MYNFGGRSKRELSCLEIRSSSRFLREIWISYFARRILEGIFVGGIVNIRNECLFFSVHGKWIKCGTNKSHENRFAVHAICLFRTAIHFPWTEKKDTYSLKNWSEKVKIELVLCVKLAHLMICLINGFEYNIYISVLPIGHGRIIIHVLLFLFSS